MNPKQIIASLLLAGLAGLAQAQTYPNKQITILCWSAAGSPVDIYARTLAKLLTPELGQNVVVENRTGGGGRIAAQQYLRTEGRLYIRALLSYFVKLFPTIAIYDKNYYRKSKLEFPNYRHLNQ